MIWNVTASLRMVSSPNLLKSDSETEQTELTLHQTAVLHDLEPVKTRNLGKALSKALNCHFEVEALFNSLFFQDFLNFFEDFLNFFRSFFSRFFKFFAHRFSSNQYAFSVVCKYNYDYLA